MYRLIAAASTRFDTAKATPWHGAGVQRTAPPAGGSGGERGAEWVEIVAPKLEHAEVTRAAPAVPVRATREEEPEAAGELLAQDPVSPAGVGAEGFEGVQARGGEGRGVIDQGLARRVSPRGDAPQRAGDPDALDEGQIDEWDGVAPGKGADGLAYVIGVAECDQGATQVVPSEGQLAVVCMGRRRGQLRDAEGVHSGIVATSAGAGLGAAEIAKGRGGLPREVDEQVVLLPLVRPGELGARHHPHQPVTAAMHTRVQTTDEVVIGERDDIEPTTRRTLEDLLGLESAVGARGVHVQVIGGAAGKVTHELPIREGLLGVVRCRRGGGRAEDKGLPYREPTHHTATTTLDDPGSGEAPIVPPETP